ncbi:MULTISPECIES: DUF4843 domain-containing protein [Sphingobacterium]|jgi:hypothetical protein|uniref:DUF4843 domain-containing protein n=1 Tax=Sphingobacterium TaxID=28453 RepID=UPI00257AE3A4|nr:MULTISPECIES: DUF4843 domain-containing protein [Sphingobacterium]MDF2850017.1 hypothetical protein [Sphingobacterium multivorum]
MKKSFVFLMLTVLVFAFSCKKETVDTYSGPNILSFYLNSGESDSISYSFAMLAAPKLVDTIFLKMRMSGAPVDHARTISLKPGARTTAALGEDFEFPKVQLPAEKLTLIYPVVIHRTKKMDTDILIIDAEVESSGEYQTNLSGTEIGETRNLPNIVIKVTNLLVEPTYWPSVEYNFGTFSQVKFRFMIQSTGLNDFSDEALGYSGSYNIPVKLRNALAAYEKANGPLIDEFGNRVTF